MPVRTRTQAESLYGTPVPLSTALLPPVVATRSPTVLDTGYQLMQFWENSTTQAVFVLVAYTNGQAIWQLLSSGGSPLNTLTGDDGIPITPNAGNINIQGGPGVAAPGLGAIHFTTGFPPFVGQMDATVQVDGTTIVINGSNQLTAAGTFTAFTNTPDAVPKALVTIPLGAVAGTWMFEVIVAAHDIDDSVGSGYEILSSVFTNGAAATVVTAPDVTELEDPTFMDPSTSEVNMVAAGNNAVVQVTGIAGTSIDWRAIVRGVFVA